MQEAQQQLSQLVVSGESGGGLVMVKMNGRHDVTEVKIKPTLMDEDVEMLEDLIISAIKEALKQSKEMANSKMNSITGGMGGFPGLM